MTDILHTFIKGVMITVFKPICNPRNILMLKIYLQIQTVRLQTRCGMSFFPVLPNPSAES